MVSVHPAAWEQSVTGEVGLIIIDEARGVASSILV